MKTDLTSLKKELKRLADIDYLKKQLKRVTFDIRKLDLHLDRNPSGRGTLDQLEKRFQDIVKSINSLQKEIDRSFEQFVKVVRSKTGVGTAKKSSTGNKKSSSKKAAKSTANKSSAKASKSTKKSPARKATTKTTKKSSK